MALDTPDHDLGGATTTSPPDSRPATDPLVPGTGAHAGAPGAGSTATTTAEPATATGSGRLFFVDNLRIFLTVLVLAHHLAVTYGNIPVWMYREPPADPAWGVPLDLLVIVNQMYFMGFFFLISGYFTPRSVDRRGPRRFAVDRLSRLGIPLIGFLLLLRPLYSLGVYLEIPAPERPPYLAFYVGTWDPGPMWFVEVLLVFALAYALVRHLRGGRGAAGPATSVPALERSPAPPRYWSVLAFGVALGLVSYAWRILVPIGTYVPVLGLPSASYLPQYASLFVVGIVAYRRGWLASIPGRYGVFGGLTALLAVVVLGPLTGVAGPAATAPGAVETAPVGPPPGSLPTLATALMDSLFAVGVILVLFTVFRRFFRTQGPVLSFASRNAFAVYVLHPPILVGLGYAFSGLELNTLVKFALVLAVAVPTCWLLAAAVRTLPIARRVL